MAGVRSMLARVRRIEAVRAPGLSPIAAAFGSFDAFSTWADEQVAGGVLDPRDFSIVVLCLRSWERDGTWGERWSPAGTWRPGP